MKIDIRWVRPDNMHLTLKFLGEIPIESCKEMEAAIAMAADGVAPINLAVKGVGVFSNIKHARVIWAGMAGDTGGLVNFQQHLDAHLSKIGIGPEKRPYRAHLTLGRINRKLDPAHLLNALSRVGTFQPESFLTHRLTRFKSELMPTGAKYTPLYTKRLA